MAKKKTIKNENGEILHPVTDVTAVEGLDEALAAKQDVLQSGENIKTINGESILGSGNILVDGGGSTISVDSEMSLTSENPVQNKVITQAVNAKYTKPAGGIPASDLAPGTTLSFKPFNSSWPTSTTLEAFCAAVMADTSATVGMSYYGGLSCSGLPTGMIQGDVIVEILGESNNKVIKLEMSSTEVAPYNWEGSYWAGTFTGWKSWQEKLVSGENIKTVNGTSLLGSGNIQAGEPNAVKFTEQELTDAQKTQARTNIDSYKKPTSGIPSTDLDSATQTSLGKADSAYQKPGTGIPSSDMASGVQTSLGKADTAYQKPAGGIPKSDLDSGVQESLDLADSAIQSEPVGQVTPPVDPSLWATKEEVEELDLKVKYKVGADIGVNSTADSWKLNGTGLCVSDNTARMRKYQVTAGTYIYLKLTADTAGVYQFQSAASVPSSGTNANLVGTPVNVATDGMVLVPTGATYLIVSELKTNTTNVVKSTTALHLEDIGSSEALVAGTTAGGTILPSGIWASSSSYRIKKYAVSEGQLLYMKLSKDTDVVYQWQNNVSIPSVAPNSYLIGLPFTSAVDGFVFVPTGATYLMVVESTSNTTNSVTLTDKNSDIVSLLKKTDTDTKVVNEDDFEVKNTSVNFSKRGFYITKNLNLDSSSYWYMSDPILVKKGKKISITATDTGVSTYLLVGVNSSTPITSISDVRTFSVITELSPGSQSTYVTREWIATEDTYVIAQRYNITSLYLGNPAVLPELAELWGLVHNLPSGDELPDYVKNERDRVYGIIVNRSLGDVHISAFNTDQHFDLDRLDIPTSTYNPKWVMQGVRAMKEICDQIPVDMVILGGDVAGYGGGTSNDVEGIVKTADYLFAPLVGIDSILVGIPGNHDAYQNNGNVTAQSMYNAFAKRNQRHLYYHGNGTDNCDAYVDDTRHKIRSIFIDTYSRNTRTESYQTFLTDALESLPDGYMAVVYSHNALTNEFAGSVLAQKISDPSVTIDAFQNPTDCHTILNQYADKIIACICGHSHFDASAVSSAGILYIETTTAAPHTRNYTTDSIPNTSTIGTVTDTSFDFFVIDQSAKTIEAVRYGEGCNRKWLYKGVNAGMMDGYPQAITR